MLLLSVLVGLGVQSSNPAFALGPDPLLLRHPTVNKTSIVFKFADDLWEVPREGGNAIRLTSSPGVVGDPFFSPDGTMIAFSANYDGQDNVYVIRDGGSVPRRLTAHPSPEGVVGWTPDSKDIVFTSQMLSNTDQPRLFKVSVDGGFPQPLPLPSGTEASYSPDGTHLAYVPIFRWETAWKRYRGGQAYKIWIANLADSKVKEIPRKDWNDNQPVWFGDKIYYLCDSTGPVGLDSYDVNTGAEKVEVAGSGFDMKSLTGGPDVLAYEKLGSIHLYNPKTHTDKTVPIQVHGDLAEVRPQYKELQPYIDSSSISPSGNRVAFAARGFVLTVPASKGDVHPTDETQGVHRRDVAWSPDGKTIAYITDVSGHRQMGLWDVAASTEKRFDLGDGPSLYGNPVWSPDSSKIFYSDYRNLGWILDAKTGTSKKAWTSERVGVSGGVWSPDSKWLAFVEMLPSHFRAIFLYSVEDGKITQVTDGLASADSPIFDHNGKYLYFAASTEIGQAATLGDISQFNNLNPVSSLYAVMLKKGMPNPLQPESDEEPGATAPATPPTPPKAAEGAKPDSGAPTPPPGPASPGSHWKYDSAKGWTQVKDATVVSIDIDGIQNRIIALPTPAQLYTGLVPATDGAFYALVRSAFTGPERMNPLQTAQKFTWATKSMAPAFPMITGLDTTPDGTKALVSRGGTYFIVPTMMPAGLDSPLNLSGLTIKIDPRKEWAHMFHEIWAEAPLHFYSPITNGIDPKEMDRRYSPFLAKMSSRDDLNHLFDDMLGELCVGHEFPGGGDMPSGPNVNGGLLGADYDFTGGHYKITRVYTGEEWNPGLYAPLAQPGVDAKAGEYVLAIDGQPLTTATDIYLMLENKAGKQVKVKLGPNPDGTGSREVTVVPVASEFGLRSRAWEEDNRRLVAKETTGRAGYVHVPDTETGGWLAFNRYYYAQTDKDGMVVDERFNHGGLFNDFMIHEMEKKLFAYFAPRYGVDEPTPAAAVYGPKVMLINEFAGSGGDMFPWLFRHDKVGPLIGMRTWGGLIAVQPLTLVDGGDYTAPDFAFYDPVSGRWDVENWGVAPDIQVDLDPYLWRQGKDSQLERAIQEENKLLAGYKPLEHKRPAYPDRTKLDIHP
ncbi:MAG TPA: PDZ domain-containing protein [Fimbriimonadaceae bacterium]|nr:PDZ domain-containing protein [Fimbriimonadaceae bacterium]